MLQLLPKICFTKGMREANIGFVSANSIFWSGNNQNWQAQNTWHIVCRRCFALLYKAWLDLKLWWVMLRVANKDEIGTELPQISKKCALVENSDSRCGWKMFNPVRICAKIQVIECCSCCYSKFFYQSNLQLVYDRIVCLNVKPNLSFFATFVSAEPPEFHWFKKSSKIRRENSFDWTNLGTLFLVVHYFMLQQMFKRGELWYLSGPLRWKGNLRFTVSTLQPLGIVFFSEVCNCSRISASSHVCDDLGGNFQFSSVFPRLLFVSWF